MSLTLIVLRHAKSDWTQNGDDHDRPLNPRGFRDAPKIGNWLASQGLVPDAATVSSARRTQQTWAAIADAFPTPPKLRTDPRLYNAPPDAILSAARTATGQTHAIVAHNPGMGTFMHHILRHAPNHARFSDTPTGATLVLTFDTDRWDTITWGAGRAMAFITPHDL